MQYAVHRTSQMRWSYAIFCQTRDAVRGIKHVIPGQQPSQGSEWALKEQNDKQSIFCNLEEKRSRNPSKIGT
jgi:hypothetical protein